MLTITTAATSLALLTASQLRAAAGLADADTSQDATLAVLDLRVAADIAAACDIAIGAGEPPTLLQETLSETFRGVNKGILVLSRKHDVVITSVTVDSTLLVAADYEVDPETGILCRLSGTSQIKWAGSLITVVYQAGFTAVTSDLLGAATDLVRLRLSEENRDPMLRSELTEVPDVLTERRDYWVGGFHAGGAGGIPTHIMQRLSRYKNVSIG